MLSKRLGMVLSIPNTLHHSLAPVLKAYKRYSPKFHKMDDVPVEVALVSTVIIVLKLVYGLDGIKRYALIRCAGRLFLSSRSGSLPRKKTWHTLYQSYLIS